jgi:hypothetical protein
MRSKDDTLVTLCLIGLALLGVSFGPRLADAFHANYVATAPDPSPYGERGQIPIEIQVRTLRQNYRNVEFDHQRAVANDAGRRDPFGSTREGVRVSYTHSVDSFNDYVRFAATAKALQASGCPHGVSPDTRYYIASGDRDASVLGSYRPSDHEPH